MQLPAAEQATAAAQEPGQAAPGQWHHPADAVQHSGQTWPDLDTQGLAAVTEAGTPVAEAVSSPFTSDNAISSSSGDSIAWSSQRKV